MDVEFTNKVLIIGYGSVARCMLPILLKHVSIPFDRITVVDALDKEEELAPWTAQGLRFLRIKITPENLDDFLSAHLSPGDMVIDVA